MNSWALGPTLLPSGARTNELSTKGFTERLHTDYTKSTFSLQLVLPRHKFTQRFVVLTEESTSCDITSPPLSWSQVFSL